MLLETRDEGSRNQLKLLACLPPSQLTLSQFLGLKKSGDRQVLCVVRKRWWADFEALKMVKGSVRLFSSKGHMFTD